MGKKIISKGVYSDDYIVKDTETGEKERFVKYGGIFTEGYISNKGNQVSWDKIRDNKEIKRKEDKNTNTYQPYGNDRNYEPVSEPKPNVSGTGYQYYDPRRLPKYPSRKNLFIWCGIMVYCVLASIFKAIPRPDMLCHALLAIGFLQYAAAAGSDRDVTFREYFFIGGGLWLLQLICHILIFAYPRNMANYSEHFWSSGFKLAGAVYLAGLVLFALGKAGIFRKIFGLSKGR